MRIEASVTSISWIPSEAISGPMRLPMDIGLGHYDPPPPSTVDDEILNSLLEDDGFRASNRLAAWIEVEDGAIIETGYSGRALVGATTAKLGPKTIVFPGIGFPILRDEPMVEDGVARFVQTVGARTGAPMPRRINRPPYIRISGPTTWVTLSLEIGVDGSISHDVVGASPFPRHWIYDTGGTLVAKSGVVDWSEWNRVHDHDRSPWHGVERDALIAEAETEVERAFSTSLMGHKPEIRMVADGSSLTIQGDPGDDLYLVLDGMFQVDVDGEIVAELGPGAIVGERAVIEGGTRTATVRAITAAKVAVVHSAAFEPSDLIEVAVGHRREES